MRSIRNTKMTAAVVATLSALWGASMASAQFRVGQDGHANDASNRVGSGGINQGGSPSNQLVTGNDIVLGNVTGGRQFRGGIGYTDPLAFRGVLPGTGVDAFVRDSAGVPQANQPSFGLDTPRAFFGDSRGVTAPIGSVRQGFTGSYVGTALTPANPYTSFLSAPGYQNFRPGNTTVVAPQSYSGLQPSINTLPGSIDSSLPNDQAALMGSPLTGVRQPPAAPGAGNTAGDRLNALRPTEALQTSPDAGNIQQMRAELNNPALSNDVNNTGNGTNNPNGNGPAAPGAPGTPGAPANGQPGNINRTQGSQPLQQGRDLTARAAIPNAPLNNPVTGQQLNSGTDQTQQLVPPGKIGSQYSELNDRLNAFHQTHPMTDVERIQRLRQKNAKTTGKPNPGALPGTATKPATGVPAASQPDAAPDNTPANPKPGDATPLQVGSLATGIRAKGLHDLMAGAEDLMHQGKFASAIIKYNEAERVAPNYSLIPLGRAQAELGAGYYGKAESDLRHVFASDPAVLMGQYDLKKFLSQQRLDYLNKDLTDLAKNETRSERNWFLLAYIAYNTGDAAGASRYLDEAEKRGSTKDPILQLMRTHWSLQNSTPATKPSDLNK